MKSVDKAFLWRLDVSKEIFGRSAKKYPLEKRGLEEELVLLVGVVEEASAIALHYWEQGVTAQVKTDFYDIRTEADLAVGEFLETSLKALYPLFTIIEEETGGVESPNLFTIDPIDGTNAFERGMEDWCIAIAKIVSGQPVVGVIAAPARRTPEVYVGYTGYGAYLNGEPIMVSSIETTKEGTITVGHRNICQEENSSIRRLTGQFRQLWVPASTSFALANIARGRSDVAAVQDQPIWDIAPGFVVVREAGGKATLWNGDEQLDISGNSTNNILVTNGLLHEQLSRQLVDC